MQGHGNIPGQPRQHEIYVWDSHEFLAEMHRLKAAVRTGVEANDTLKATIDADIIALGQLVQSGTKIGQQIRLLGLMGRAYMKEVNGKRYIIFKGNQALRPNLRGTRYLAENAKVRCFVIGGKEILSDVAHGTKIAVIAFVAIDIVAYLSDDKPSLASLGVHIASDVLQAVAASAIGYVAGAIILASSPAAPVVLVFVVVVAVGFGVGMFLTNLDNQYRLTDRAVARMKAYEIELEKKLPAIRHSLLQFETQAARIGENAKNKAVRYEERAEGVAGRVVTTIKVEAYRVDRYFRSIKEMVEVDAGKMIGR